MKLTHSDFWWLCRHQPLLTTRLSDEVAEGMLAISAYYDEESGRIVSGEDVTARSHHSYVADRFAVRLELGVDNAAEWPRVYDTGFRYRSIAKRYGCPIEDLHFYPTGEACLGFEFPWDPAFTMEFFITDIVEPFFYRLAYVDLYGLHAARTDLWPEHSHGILGLTEHREDVRRGLRNRQSPGGRKDRTPAYRRR